MHNLFLFSMEIDTFTMHLDFEQSGTTTEENATAGETGTFVYSFLCLFLKALFFFWSEKEIGMYTSRSATLFLILFCFLLLICSSQKVAAGCAPTPPIRITTIITKRAPFRYITTLASRVSRRVWKR